MTVACPCCKAPKSISDDTEVKCSTCGTTYVVENKVSRCEEVDDLGRHDRSYVIPRESQRDMERRRMALMKGQR